MNREIEQAPQQQSVDRNEHLAALALRTDAIFHYPGQSAHTVTDYGIYDDITTKTGTTEKRFDSEDRKLRSENRTNSDGSYK
jgi:hypothetical protein